MGIISIRLSKLYFVLCFRISMGSLVWAIVYRWYSFTGGDNGIYDIEIPDMLSSYQGAYYFYVDHHGHLTLRPVRILNRPMAASSRAYGTTLCGAR